MGLKSTLPIVVRHSMAATAPDATAAPRIAFETSSMTWRGTSKAFELRGGSASLTRLCGVYCKDWQGRYKQASTCSVLHSAVNERSGGACGRWYQLCCDSHVAFTTSGGSTATTALIGSLVKDAPWTW